MNTFIIDFETDGLNPYHANIIEIGIKLCDVDKEYSTLIKIDKPLSEEIISVTGITNENLIKNGIEKVAAYNGMLNFIIDNKSGDYITIVAHNGDGFDFIFFKRILRELKSNNLNIKYLDTLKIAKYFMPNQRSFKLSSLCKYYRIEFESAHRAMFDVYALEKIYKVFVDKGLYSNIEYI